MQDHHAAAPTDSLRSDSWSSREISISEWFSSAIHEADPNHMYLGCRFHGEALPDPELFRAIGKYAAAVSVNVYGIWQLDSEITTTWERESGKAFLVTEFYAKGEDSGMPNHTDAGWLVHTQDDRGLFYENFVLARACVGWLWFKYCFADNLSGTAVGFAIGANVQGRLVLIALHKLTNSVGHCLTRLLNPRLQRGNVRSLRNLRALCSVKYVEDSCRNRSTSMVADRNPNTNVSCDKA